MTPRQRGLPPQSAGGFFLSPAPLPKKMNERTF